MAENNYRRRLQLKHFFEDRQTGAKRRTWMEVQFQSPRLNPAGWVNDGKIRLSLGEESNVKGAFLLSIDEACRLLKVLDLIVEEHEVEKARLWSE